MNLLAHFIRTLVLIVVANLAFLPLLLLQSDALASVASLETVLTVIVLLTLLLVLGLVDSGLSRLVNKEEFPAKSGYWGQLWRTSLLLFILAVPFALIMFIDQPEKLWQVLASFVGIGFLAHRLYLVNAQKTIYRAVYRNSWVASVALIFFLVISFPEVLTSVEAPYRYGLLLTYLLATDYILSSLLLVVYRGLAELYQVTFWSNDLTSTAQPKTAAVPEEQTAAEARE